ncbi:MAG: redox-regulated ATPase YchF [Candidatus Schekmanbacteria bacterium RIFCSPHIGHO2_02_FULL_38_11]|nr:MAG: redox-regulated ATPase YchF [Candidatus Schekmanbacteria bacterium RIFCSPLOWO2_02_FULL_38_14]OGL50648.1 MAG: redox-regulated ATPase YchF [Candidatus Schekmanbacteria bacterium RIFCSPHIGHO2_02_FULL_38_11]
MIIGIVGLPNCGKTALFNAITRGDAEVASYAQTMAEPNVGVAFVPDKRIDRLCEVFKPQKTTYASVKYIDMPGLQKGSLSEGTKITEFLARAREVDALVHVVRVFEDASVQNPAGSIDPLRDAKDLELEFILSDLSIIEKRLERIEADLKKGIERQKREIEKQLLSGFKEILEKETPMRNINVKPEDEKLIRGYQFLTLKPMVVVLNIHENHINSDETEKLSAHIRKNFSGEMDRTVAVCAKTEMEISQLPVEESQMFMDELGIKESAMSKLINACYDILGLISFLTVGEDEVRAWTIKKGSNACNAGGVIHSDIERGFIKAEVISYEDFMEAGSISNARSKGTFRLESRNYVVSDGDIINFKFNV